MKRRTVSVAAGVVALAVTFGLASSASGQEVTLRYRWAKGETVRYRITQKASITVSGLPGGMGEVTINSTVSQVVRNVVEDVAADGTATVRQVYESVRVENESPVKMTYDSTAPESTSADPGSTMLKDTFSAMIGESFVLVLSPTGTVQKVEGMSRIMEKMFAKFPQQDPAMGMMVNGLRTSMSDDAMKNTFSQGFGQFPDRPLKVGDTWNNEVKFSNPMIGGMTTAITSTLKGLEGSGASQVATIATKATLKPDSSTPVANPMGLTMQMGEGSGEGEIVFDVVKGQLQRGVTETTMPITMWVPRRMGPPSTPRWPPRRRSRWSS